MTQGHSVFTMKTEDTELNQARSKPNTVDRPIRTARTIVHHYNSTQYCNTELFQYSPSSRPTSYLRCGQVEEGDRAVEKEMRK